MIPRMRTAAGVLRELKKEDPSTEITLHYIRSLIHNNKLPIVAAGKKKLVNLDEVLALLAAGAPPIEVNGQGNRIRRVAV